MLRACTFYRPYPTTMKDILPLLELVDFVFFFIDSLLCINIDKSDAKTNGISSSILSSNTLTTCK